MRVCYAKLASLWLLAQVMLSVLREILRESAPTRSPGRGHIGKKGMAVRVLVNIDLCQGHARCEEICPEVFATDAVEGKCVIATPEVPVELEDKVRLAVRNCPEGALRIAKSAQATE